MKIRKLKVRTPTGMSTGQYNHVYRDIVCKAKVDSYLLKGTHIKDARSNLTWDWVLKEVDRDTLRWDEWAV